MATIKHKKNNLFSRFAKPLALATCVVALLASTALEAQSSKIVTRPLTPQEITDHGLSNAQKSGGLPTIGVGEAAYLEVQVPTGTVVNGVEWDITAMPGGSAATLVASPLGMDIPIYDPADRPVNDIADRMLLIPDAAGSYMVEAVVSTDGDPINVSIWVTAAYYVGSGGTPPDDWTMPQCSFCHEKTYDAWKETRHSMALPGKLDGIETDHFREYCLSCHTVGYNLAATAVNDGFDDIQAEVGWVFPEHGEPGNWDAVPEELKAVSNIQCENCHGPGSEHGGWTEQNEISISLSSGDCGQCHDAAPYHNINKEWNQSGHSVVTRYATGSERRQGCVRCHAGLGFIDYADGKAEEEFRFEYAAITCQVCHDPHHADNEHQLRKLDNVTLLNGEVIEIGGKARICMNCHQSRRDAEDYVTEYHSHYGPHYSCQTDMFMGTNAIEYGKEIASTGHATAMENTCLECHMVDGGDVDHMAGGHTWKMRYMMDEQEVDHVSACVRCHGNIQNFDFAQDDSDHDGLAEGIQDEIHGLLHHLGEMLPPLGDSSVSVASDYTPGELKAAYNFFFVEEDGSFGIHNPSYAVGILKASIEDMEVNDYDQDGLNDRTEVDLFGDMTSQTGASDFDGDGLSNARELKLGTNPLLADSDGDGYDDFTELLVGNDPLNGDDNPTVEPRLYTAMELRLTAETGKTYQIQKASEVGTWEDVGDEIVGEDAVVQQFFSIIGTSKEFYRVIIVTGN